MAKIHILEKRLNGGSPNRTGVVCAVYHINLSGGVTVNPAVPVAQAGGFGVDVQDLVAGKIEAATMQLGLSLHPTLLSTHPDFGATAEATLLTDQDLAEVQVDYHITETETNAAIAAALDALYANIQAQARTRYTELLGFYGTERNPT